VVLLWQAPPSTLKAIVNPFEQFGGRDGKLTMADIPLQYLKQLNDLVANIRSPFQAPVQRSLRGSKNAEIPGPSFESLLMLLDKPIMVVAGRRQHRQQVSEKVIASSGPIADGLFVSRHVTMLDAAKAAVLLNEWKRNLKVIIADRYGVGNRLNLVYHQPNELRSSWNAG
jgi:hypothetical protein